jgi:hypothetical protein
VTGAASAHHAVRLLIVFIVACALACEQQPPPRELPTISAEPPTRAAIEAQLRLPSRTGSVKFAVIGDAGRGSPPQYQVSAQMQAYRQVFPFDFVVMAGDNVYDGGTALDYREKFERPYKPLLDARVQFYAAIGNHDDVNQPGYRLFNMGGRRYYSFKPPSMVSRVLGADVQFFMLDTENLDLTQRAWLDREMTASTAEWKIPVFHRPLYTSGRYDLGGRQLRAALEPIFVKHHVSVAFSGHEHFYERVRPQHGVTYFTSGGAGSLRVGDVRRTDITAVAFDRDYHFMLVEIDDDELFFQAIARTGTSVDAGVVRRNSDGTSTTDTLGPTLAPPPSP